jgi:hypothetical protein
MEVTSNAENASVRPDLPAYQDEANVMICQQLPCLSIELFSDHRRSRRQAHDRRIPSETFALSPRSVRMASGKSILERAFEIAVSGEVTSLRQLARALRAEGYDTTEIVEAGRVLRRQLNELMAAARPNAGGSTYH